MLNYSIINVAIGLFFIFLTYSLLATALQEAIATLFNLRAIVLNKAIFRMLDGTAQGFLFRWCKKNKAQRLSTDFYNSPVIKASGNHALYNGPASIQNSTFADAVIFTLKQKSGSDNCADFKPYTGNPAHPDGKGTYLSYLIDEAGGDLEKFKKELEQWFDDMMNQTSAWYKTTVQIILFFIGLLFAVSFNIDTVKIVNRLSKDKVAQQQLVDLAIARYQSQDPALNTGADSLLVNDTTLIRNLQQSSDSLNVIMAFGYGKGDSPCIEAGQHPRSLAGWLITAIAISLGAPFWYDLLSKFVRIRSAIPGEGKK